VCIVVKNPLPWKRGEKYSIIKQERGKMKRKARLTEGKTPSAQNTALLSKLIQYRTLGPCEIRGISVAGLGFPELGGIRGKQNPAYPEQLKTW